MPHIFCGHNFLGAGNFGDDLMLEGFVRRLTALPAPPTIVAFTPHDLKSQQRRLPAIRWLPDDPARLEWELAVADIWLGLAGTPFQVESGDWMLEHLERERERCVRLKKPMVYLGVGCNSPDLVRDLRWRRLIKSAERIWARDARSAELLDAVASPGVVAHGADLAHIALAAKTPPSLEEGLVGVLLGLQGPGIVDILAVEAYLAERRPGSTRWLVQEERWFPCTERWNYAGLSEWTQQRLALMPFAYATDSTDAFLANFGTPEAVVSSRYHGALVAAWHGSRLAVIARTAKLHGIVADLEVPALPAIDRADKLVALERDGVRVDRLRLESLRAQASGMCDQFFAWLGKHDAERSAGKSKRGPVRPTEPSYGEEAAAD
jgi:hypothetical protein